jgi:hypothetical protein
MAADVNNDRLGTLKDTTFSTSWDWKGTYVSDLAEEGYERFSQFSATPDTTLLFGGPARFTGLAGDTGALVPIGLTEGVNMNTNPQLTRIYEIGSARSFFTRGKTASNISFNRMLADQGNILNILARNAYRPVMNIDGTKAPGAELPNPEIMMNLDSEYFAVPFGMLIVFKTRGGGSGTGKILSASYLEYCMFSNYSFNITTTTPVIMEGVAMEYDRIVPVSFQS